MSIIPAGEFICGPDVTAQIGMTWTRIQNDFKTWSHKDKIRACKTVLFPYKSANDVDIGIAGVPLSIEQLKQKIQAHADIDGWDTLPLYQGDSLWLRTPPIYDPATNGPCATPSSSDYNNPDQFAAGHEDPNTCSNTVQVAGQCWLNGTVNYGTFGIMVKLCSDFALSHPYLLIDPLISTTFNIAWARTLIRAYKKFGQNPEGAVLPIAWTDATYKGGPRGIPNVAGNRPRCKCSGGCSGDAPTTNWDYIWSPMKTFGRDTYR